MDAQVIDDTRDVVGGGHHRGLRTAASPPAPVVGPQAVAAATPRRRRQPERLPGAVTSLERAPASELPPGAFVARGQTQPSTEGLGMRPLPRLQAEFSEDGVHGAGMQAGMATKSTPVS
jgi:hypothetical protein